MRGRKRRGRKGKKGGCYMYIKNAEQSTGIHVRLEMPIHTEHRTRQGEGEAYHTIKRNSA